MIVHRRAMHPRTRDSLDQKFEDSILADISDIRSVIGATQRGFNCVLACGRVEERILEKESPLVIAFEKAAAKAQKILQISVEEWSEGLCESM